MTDLLAKARLGRLAALDKCPTNDLIREAVLRIVTARAGTVIPFQSRRSGLAA